MDITNITILKIVQEKKLGFLHVEVQFAKQMTFKHKNMNNLEVTFQAINKRNDRSITKLLIVFAYENLKSRKSFDWLRLSNVVNTNSLVP